MTVVEVVNKLIFYFQYPFVRHAMVVGTLIALCSSLLGVTLVLKRFSFIGDGLSHVAFGAIAIAAAMKSILPTLPPLWRSGAMAVVTAMDMTDDFLLVLPVTLICAILLLRTGQNAKIKGDAAIAMISVGTLAIGYLLMNLFSESSNISGDVCATLFGSTAILTLTEAEMWLCVFFSILVMLIFILFYHRIFAITFDEDFTAATGNRASSYNLLLAVIIAVIVVLAMNLVGSLLISALVIFPALSAMRVFKTFLSVTICSAIISVFCAGLGILIAILMGTPVGSTIVAVDIAGFAVFSIAGWYSGH